ncbi:fimbria/pilus outer membrane usher protein [Kluyvera genomosp. 1]|uniref:fimbria/pilus outer membrane usher protein n=1 Tax=Kluyvera genomosp. 1 TaxID=2774053 RepID=UPI000691817F|nr:fimbria/pilus outer membrane usher protein [Kluyvera genomosp. 1]
MCRISESTAFKYARLAYLIAFAISGFTQTASARDYFNPELLERDSTGKRDVDLSAFENGSQIPGTYRVDVLLDQQDIDTRDITFTANNDPDGEGSLQPCISVDLLKSWGVKTELFPGLSKTGDCADLSAIPQATTEFQFSAQRLLISIPQAALSQQARGYVPPAQWDEGITAAMLNYSLSGDNNWARNGSDGGSNSQYMNLRPGVNIGPWRLRNYTTWNRDSNGQDNWDTVYTYLQRAIIPLKAQLTVGDSSSPGDIFDSLPFRGAQIASDDDMIPDSQKGYAPVIRGIARTNAQVVIRQNGYVIYQSYVAPGAFEITDMYPTGSAGDLNVTVKEADGSEQKFTVPFASLPVLQREGRFKYAITGGQYRSYNSSVDKTSYGQITAIYGLPRGFTIYGGVQQSDKYQSAALGSGINMGALGAFSTDVTMAKSSPYQQDSSSGQSWRIRYSKNFVETGTNFAIAGYRYSTSGYYGMQEVLDSYGDSSALQDRRRNRMELTLSQTLGDDLGSLSISGVREDYWNSDQSMESLSVGYNNNWKGITYGVTYTYSKNGGGEYYGNTATYDHDQQLALNIGIPLERFLPGTWAGYSMNSSKNNGTTHNVSLNGVALENNALSWGVQQGYGTNNMGYSGSTNADYKGTYGEVSGGYSYDDNTERLNYGLQGGIIAHANGITLSQPLNETNVLIQAPGAHGVSVQNQTGVKTDFRGYTVAGNVTPYRENTLTLNPLSMPDDVDLELTSQTVVPTRGAIVRARYNTNRGLKILLTLVNADGNAVPFGATVVNAEHQDKSFIVGEQGQVYLTGMEPTGSLSVDWGNDAKRRCRVNYDTTGAEVTAGIVMLSARCTH